MSMTLDWLGCATFRLAIDGLVVYLDTFVDRPTGAPAVGVTTAEITEADFALIGHSHWDHLAGADIVAKNSGAIVIGSHESARVLRERGARRAALAFAGRRALPAERRGHGARAAQPAFVHLESSRTPPASR